MKTRMQNAPPGQYEGVLSVVKDLLATSSDSVPSKGPNSNHGSVQVNPSLLRRAFAFTAFFKGITPAFVRIGPHTILLFIFKEQLTIYFGFQKSMWESTTQQIDQSVNRPTYQSVNQSDNQLINQSVNQTTGRSTARWLFEVALSQLILCASIRFYHSD